MHGIIPTPSLIINLNLKVMATKCNIRLNSREQISLCFGNSTPFVIEGKVINKPYVMPTKGIRATENYLGIDLNDVRHDIKKLFKPKSFFDRVVCGSIADTNNKKLGDFLNSCNNAVLTYPDRFKTAKEIGLFVLGGCKDENTNPTITLGEYMNIIIDRQKGKAENPDSMNYQVYKTLKNALKDWEGGNKLNQSISSLYQSDFEKLSKYLKERKGKNGKKGANWERLMQCYRAVINNAINDSSIITGCTISNAVKLAKNNPTTQYKVRTNKSIVELYNEKNKKGAMTFEQVETFKQIDPTTLCVKIATRHNGKSYEYTLKKEYVDLCYDILLFMLYAVGIRPIDAIRISHKNFDWEHNQLVYLPSKKKRFNNDDNDVTKHIVSIPINEGIIRLFNKYKNTDSNGFLFPCPCNTKSMGEYNYKRINQFEDYMNKVIQTIGVIIGLDFKPTSYTMRKTAITLGVDNDLKKAKIVAIEKIAKLAGTSTMYINDTYYKSVNQ